MRNSRNTKGIIRIVDANINRAKEGLRVCEEICRFIIDNRSLTARCKALRHAFEGMTKELAPLNELLKERNSPKDVGRTLHHAKELKRKNVRDIYLANIQRVKESLRVLEEFSKLKSVSLALGFKMIRYDVYELEKKITCSLAPVCRHR